ncbi:MAG: pyridoxamine 5'-phosphate oxidase family protein [Candidatus Aminicenantes bacterium]|nr:MAG: pyridoxamine 5'-phosphate oxidase family protein [Candidatus Aminicenantes bacterium]
MRSIRRREKEISDKKELWAILDEAKYVVVAMCKDNEPYLATLSHGYDRKRNCIYFHCAKEGKKVDILKEQNKVWGQALMDKGYVQGSCDHLFATTQFMGRITFVENRDEKKHALEVMINALEDNPQKVLDSELTEKSIEDVQIGRIDIEYMSGKKSEKVIISV